MVPYTLKLGFRREFDRLEAVVFRSEADIPELISFAGGYTTDLYTNSFGLTCAYTTADGQEFQMYPGCALYRIPGSSKIYIAPVSVLTDLFVDITMSTDSFDTMWGK